MDSRYIHFTVLILGIRKLIAKIKDFEMAEFGLKGIHLTCLFYVSELKEKNVEVTATDICKVSGEDKAAISRVVSDLESNGFLIQEKGDKKKYRANIELTKKGEEIVKKINDKIFDYENKASKDLSDTERKSLYTSLESIYNNLNMLIENKK